MHLVGFTVEIVKGKIHRKTCHKGREGEYSSILSLTSELDESGCLTPGPGRFTHGKRPVIIVQEAGWARGPAGRVRKSLPQMEFDPRTVQPVASRYIDCAIPVHALFKVIKNICGVWQIRRWCCSVRDF